MPWRYAEPPYTSMPSYRMTGIRFAIGGIGAGASRQRRRPLHRSISRHSGHPVTSPSTTPPADECHAASDGQQHDRPLTATRPWRTGHAGSAGHHAGCAALPSCRHPTRWAQSARHHLARSAPSACLAFTVTVRSAVAVLPALSTSARTLPASPRPPNRTP